MSAIETEDAWQIKAACRGPQSDLFFPPTHFEKKSEKESRERQAKSICSTCSVAKACLDYSVRIREPHGVWGGFNEAERRQIMAAKQEAS